MNCGQQPPVVSRDGTHTNLVSLPSSMPPNHGFQLPKTVSASTTSVTYVSSLCNIAGTRPGLASIPPNHGFQPNRLPSSTMSSSTSNTVNYSLHQSNAAWAPTTTSSQAPSAANTVNNGFLHPNPNTRWTPTNMSHTPGAPTSVNHGFHSTQPTSYGQPLSFGDYHGSRTQNHMSSSYGQPVSFADQRHSMINCPPSLHQPDHQSGAGSNSLNTYCEYLYRRDIITKNVVDFDDDPSNYRIWECGIDKLAKNAGLAADEILGLMLTKTIETSAAHELIKRLSKVYIRNPILGLQETHKRLQDRFGADDQICNALYTKLENLSRVPSNDPKALQSFSDTLEEVYAAYMDDSLHGLKALDSPIILKLVIGKLPRELIDKWRNEAYKYKERYKVVFPPFSALVDFLIRMSNIRNDPSLLIENSPIHLSTFHTTVDHERHQQTQSTASFTPYEHPTPPSDEVDVFRTEMNRSHGNREQMNTDRNHGNRELMQTDRNHGNRERTIAQSNGENYDRGDRREVSFTKVDDLHQTCPIHVKPHAFAECRQFRRIPLAERKKYLIDNHICSRCISAYHDSVKCKIEVKCKLCDSLHHTAMHEGPRKQKSRGQNHGEEPVQAETMAEVVQSKCTTVCGSKNSASTSCSKVVLAKIYPKNQREKAIHVYVVIDEMSNRSLATSDIFEHFQIHSSEHTYILHTCAGSTTETGRKLHELVIESADGDVIGTLPPITECGHVSCGKTEIPDPDKVALHPHLTSVAKYIPPLHEDAKISLLLGRDCPRFLKVYETINGDGPNEPWAHRLELGWTVLGSLCLNGMHLPTSPDTIETRCTEIADGNNLARPTNLEPCRQKIKIQDTTCYSSRDRDVPLHGPFHNSGANIYEITEDDEKLGHSIEDQKFIKIMEGGFRQTKEGNWEAPLPFKDNHPPLPCNRLLALNRFKSLIAELAKKFAKRKDYFEFMGNIFARHHAERAPPNTRGRWYLPHFGVYHPRKQKLRVVFDSSAVYKLIHSLNRALISGPNMVSSISCTLMKFRMEIVAFIADIEQMFHSFHVYAEHRDFLRFFWFAENDPEKEIVEYRMRVHVFGNSPSPAVAISGLSKTADVYAPEFGEDCKDFVQHHFYVDDGLHSKPDDESAIDILLRTQQMLAKANLRLHKIASNSQKVTEAFPPEDRAKDLRDINISEDDTPLQSSLGVSWDVKTDTFSVNPPTEEAPFTRSGASGIINGRFDPLGFSAPVTTTGKILLRRMTSKESGNNKLKWDEPLPESAKPEWQKWIDSLKHLSDVKIPRAYSQQSTSGAKHRELHVFSDASSEAIAVCIFLKLTHNDSSTSIAFVKGKSKLAPKTATTIPRLELCAAVLAVDMYLEVLDALSIHDATFYTDSKVVLGYLRNETRRFYIYVGNRVQKIRRYTEPAMWKYVPTHLNPADTATRLFTTSKLSESPWIMGPSFLNNPDQCAKLSFEDITDTTEVDWDDDQEVRPEVSVRSTHTEDMPTLKISSKRFEKFSNWMSLVGAVKSLVNAGIKTKSQSSETNSAQKTAQNLILRTVQLEAFRDEIEDLLRHGEVANSSRIRDLNPVLRDGILVVGGRIKNADFSDALRHPVILPKNHHVSILIIRYFHEENHHQGRHITHGAVRQNGFWIVGARRLIASYIHECFICRKLRGKFLVQLMADLPKERLSEAPVFTFVGIDVFGPWKIVSRRTRGGLAEDKRYALIFVCMTVRATHVEVLENMSSPCFINALRRFMALRGAVKGIFSDCGSNFVGAINELDLKEVEAFLKSKNCEFDWKFNPPHASHMGGAWERLIGVCRRVIDGILTNPKYSHRLTHEILTTMMAEVCAIVNARPLVPVSTDPEDPQVLSPAQILTMKPQTLSDHQLSNADIRSVWKFVQILADEFWSKFKIQYLAELQTRRKWRQVKVNVRIGDIVLMRTDTARNHWPLARVISTKISSDKLVRSVTLKICRCDPSNPSKVTTSTLVRPISELIMLIPSNSEND